MTKLKPVVAALSLAATMLLASNSFAQNIPPQFLGAGSSAMFQTFGFAARLDAGGTHNWSKKGGAQIIDSRSSSIPAETGNIWIVWDDTPEPNRKIWAYLTVDSVVGNRAFFAVPAATISLSSSLVGSSGDQLLPNPPMPADEALPSNIQADINGLAFNAALTDIRPEDAKFATTRALAALTTNRSGLGYGPGPIGTPIQSAFSSKLATPVDFNLSGTDPISGQPITAAHQTTNVGAAALVVFVNSTVSGPGHLGDPSFNNVNRFVLARALAGLSTRTRDLTSNATGLPSIGLHVILREPLSGTMNTMEFNIPNSKEIASSQEIGVTPPTDNPLNQTSASGGTRQRVIGTGEMVSETGAIADSLGYAFWSFGNFAKVTGTTKYLTVDGVDPIQASYTGGTFPTCPTPPCLGALTFPNIQNGTYPIWSILRVATVKPVPAGVSALISAAQTEAAQIPDFVPANQLNVFRSHYLQAGVSPQNGYKVGTTESGGDVGGAVLTIQTDLDALTDTGKQLVNLKQ